jgi:cell division protein FtsW
MLKGLLDKRNTKSPDLLLAGNVIVLLALGMLVLGSVSAAIGFQRFDDTYHFLSHQLFFGLIPGLALGFLAYKFNLAVLKKWAPILLLITLVLMMMVFLPVIGSSSATAARWIGFGPFSFQPSELLKLTFILYLAAWLSSRKERKGEDNFSQTFLAFGLIVVLIASLLILQSDLSTLGVILAVATIMYFVIDTPIRHTVLVFILGIGGLYALIKIAPYRINRLMVFLNPDYDPMGIGYQIKQSLIAIGSGGLWGTGLGLSTQKLGFLPQTISDSIFAVFSEETGFIGGVFLIALFLFFLWRGFKIVKESQDNFLKLAALGITSWIIIQTFVNIGAMIGALPLTGIPLPFISYGGSALIIELIAVGLLLNISSRTRTQ